MSAYTIRRRFVSSSYPRANPSQSLYILSIFECVLMVLCGFAGSEDTSVSECVSKGRTGASEG